MTNKQHRALLLFGAPGVGKGTQGESLGCIPGFYHFSMGDAFRALDPNSDLGQVVASYASRGELVPDEVTIQLFWMSLESLEKQNKYHSGRDLLVLDGIPRSVRQVGLIKDRVDTLAVIHLAVTSDEAQSTLVERLCKRAVEQNRADDAKDEVIRRRFEVYRAETQPILEQCPPDLVIEIDPIGTPAEVLLRVLQVVAPIQKQLVF